MVIGPEEGKLSIKANNMLLSAYNMHLCITYASEIALQNCGKTTDFLEFNLNLAFVQLISSYRLKIRIYIVYSMSLNLHII